MNIQTAEWSVRRMETTRAGIVNLAIDWLAKERSGTI